MHTRSALSDLYADHLLARGGVAPAPALIRLLASANRFIDRRLSPTTSGART